MDLAKEWFYCETDDSSEEPCAGVARLRAANATLSARVKELEEALHGLTDIYFDGINNDPETRCYESGSLREAMDEARAALNTTGGE